jgi:hypothetical protein
MQNVNLSQADLHELDRRIQEMCLLDFENFCKLAGVDKEQAYVCFEIAKGKSVRQVGIKLRLPKSTVHLIAKKCPKNMDGK